MTDFQLGTALTDCWDMLVGAANDRKAPMHTPVLASCDRDGNPNQRIMVLREANRDEAYLRFHTDSRSPKTANFTLNPSASVLGYDADKKVQLRIQGNVSVERSGDLADTAWSQSALYSRRCYMIEQHPGAKADAATTGLPKAMEGMKPSAEQTEAVRGNFAILRFTVQSIDWLYLHHEGNIAARFERRLDGEWTAHWHIP